VSESELGKVIAFYSYKGGTGRTMALANVGCALARDSKLLRPVLLVDWDLEAPGLHRYFRNQVIAAFDGNDQLFDQALGLIDLFIELRNHVVTDDDILRPKQDFQAATSLLNELPLASYIIKTDIPRLHLLKAGRFDDSYVSSISSFQWLDLYDRSPYLLRAFADRLARDYSFVAIDSRTGLTDTSGICAMLMPEILVTVFTPNRQSLFGVIDLVREAARYRAKSDDLRPLIVYPLPSRIEASEPALRQTWRFGDSSAGVPGFQRMFEQTFKEIYELPSCDLGSYFDDVQIQHLPSYAYGEEIAVLVEETHDRFSLTQSYVRFTARLKNGDAPWVSSSSLEKTSDDQDLVRHVSLESGWRWFLSYNSQDEALADTLSAAIRRIDPSSQVFVAPAWLRAGGFWSKPLADAIAEAKAFVLLVGQHGFSDWQVLEYNEALDRRTNQHDFPIVVVLLDGQRAPGLPFLRRLHWIVTTEPASEKTVAQLMDAAAGGGARARELWRHMAPYRGLSAMTESDADFFFGRERETVEAIDAIAAAPDKLPVLLGNSGVGKTSVALAGVLAALMRETWPETAIAARSWPRALSDSHRWCFLKLKPGTDPVRALVESFLGRWQFDVIDPGRLKRLAEWTDRLIQGQVNLTDLIDATERRLEEGGLSKPPAYVIYIDQGEELYVRAQVRPRRRFSEVLVEGLRDPRLRAIMSMRSDFFGELQRDELLYAVHRQINVPPLRESQLREVVNRPAELLSARFETAGLADIITRRTAEDSVKDVGALPLLSYTLDDMWTQMVARDDGVLRLPAQSFELGSVLVDRADAFLASHPKFEDELRRIFTLKLATVREGEEPTRRRASRSEFTDEQWRLVSELADHPNRLVVTATFEGSETYAEIAHDAIFRRWQKLRDWIAAEREFLAWRTGLEAARRAWQAAPDRSKPDALLMGFALAQGQRWLARRHDSLPDADREFIAQSSKAARQRARRVQALVGVLALGIVGGLVAWLNEAWLREQWLGLTVIRPYKLAQVRPYVLAAEVERTLKPGDSFEECAKNCPEMVVVPAGEFNMGSPSSEQGRNDNEGPQHRVTLAKPFAVSRFQLTFDEWDACVAIGGCAPVGDGGWGRGRHPVILVGWDHAKRYVAWLSSVTGKPYRLLTEAEYEYATRAGTVTKYPWGNEIGKDNANCANCGSQWDDKQTAPVGSFASNRFGLYDVAGNVWEWTEDCFHDDYEGAPTDGSAWISDNCNRRVVRGGSWSSQPNHLRAASRSESVAGTRVTNLGFRIARTLR
jgi:formylglycine-generating enzyme required for sulfatase activity/cellulose biosynthesis protein BcsQ